MDDDGFTDPVELKPRIERRGQLYVVVIPGGTEWGLFSFKDAQKAYTSLNERWERFAKSQRVLINAARDQRRKSNKKLIDPERLDIDPAKLAKEKDRLTRRRNANEGFEFRPPPTGYFLPSDESHPWADCIPGKYVPPDKDEVQQWAKECWDAAEKFRRAKHARQQYDKASRAGQRKMEQKTDDNLNRLQKYIDQGLTNKDIAAEMGYSESHIKTLKRNLKKRLQSS